MYYVIDKNDHQYFATVSRKTTKREFATGFKTYEEARGFKSILLRISKSQPDNDKIVPHIVNRLERRSK